MAWASATPRNSVAKGSIATPWSISVTSTTAGDLGVVGMAINSATAITVTPPSGMLAVAGTPIVVGNLQFFCFYRPNMPSGITSFSFTLSSVGTTGEMQYACWGGGSASTVPDGVNSATAPAASSTATMPSVTSDVLGQATELMVWFGTETDGSNGLTFYPTGVGTWAQIHTNSSGSGSTGSGNTDAAQLGPAAGATQTASGAVAVAGRDQCAFIVGFSATALTAPYVPLRRWGMPQAVHRASHYFARVPWRASLGGLLAPADADRRLVVAGG